MMPILSDLLSNDVLWVSVVGMMLAQFLKPFIHFLRTREWDWHQIASTGGMPSSHSTLVSSLAIGVGLTEGFGSTAFAMSVVFAMIVTYDAAGVRREAGEHARLLNTLIAEVLSGLPIEEKRLQEVLGHTRWEVTAGIAFGISLMLFWRLLIHPLF